MSTPTTKLSPVQIAEEYGVSPDTIRGWIHGGQLRAVDVSRQPGGRPRWRIDRADLATFEAARAATATPKTRRRRRHNSNVTEYF